jgi:serine protease Do
MNRNVFLSSLAGTAAGALLTVGLWTHTGGALPSNNVITVRADDSHIPAQGFAPVVRRATPAVVNISSTQLIKASENMPGMDDFFQQFFGNGNGGGRRMPQRPRDHKAQSLGSGVIVSADGYILTNNHVVDHASEVKVALSDRREFKAKIIGTDPQTDVAVLKIDAHDLPTLPLGDSSKVEIGDLALAIGNPFGIGQTVTMGIIGAKGRSLGGTVETFEDFIQTDAAINRGNSGGALINTNGQLVGINTAILGGESGGNVGIGFAIPVNMARNVMEQIEKTGKVTRGFLGVGPQELTPSLAHALKIPERSGVLLSDVEASSPAAKGGLKAGDVVTQIDGTPVTDVNSFRLKIAQTAPGTAMHIKVLRDDGAHDLTVTLGKRNEQIGEEKSQDGPSAGTPSALQGVSTEDLTPEIAHQLQLPSGTTGVVVSEVDPNSPAAEAGLHRGDVIQHVNRKPVANMAEFEKLVRQAGKQPVLLLVNRKGQTAFLAIEPK